MIWQLKTQAYNFDVWDWKPLLVGVVNVTPDSFSDGRRFFDPEQAIKHGLHLLEIGADFLDVGGESTRPGSDPVSTEEELRRVIPVISALVRKTNGNGVISIDTTKAAVAREAIAAGAEIVNDISACTFDPEMVDVLRDTGAAVCLMHIQGMPKTMQTCPVYPGDNPVPVVLDFLRKRIAVLVSGGIARDKIIIDPGLGFGKTYEHNCRLIREIARFHDLGRPVLVGHSRKSFLEAMYPDLDREAATAELSRYLVSQGVQILRVHEVSTKILSSMRMEKTLVFSEYLC